MQNIWTKWTFYISAAFACTILTLTTGCVSGGFKLTRQYAGWVNSQPVVLRVILYILTSIVFAVTMLIDVVINNTMDFWNGTVSQGTYEFKDGKKLYQVRHEFSPGTRLKHSTIKIEDLNHTLIQEVVLSETASGEIEMFIDGKLRTRVRGIAEIPIASIMDVHGNVLEENFILAVPALETKQAIATF